MTDSTPKIGKQLATNTGAALADLVLNKITNVIVFIVLTRLLIEDDIATIGVSMSYLVIIAYLDISPIRVLLRDYPQYRDDEGKRNRLLTAMFMFWVLQTVGMILLAVLMSGLLLGRHEMTGLSLLFIAMACDFAAISFGDWIKTIFYSDMRQGIATKMSLVIAVIRLLSFGLLFIWPHLDTYSIMLMLIAVLTVLAWLIFFIRAFHYHPKMDRQAIAMLRESLHDYGLWNHFNRLSIDTLFLIDTAILSWVLIAQGASGHESIANYSIALRFTSLLFVIPMQLMRALQLAIANAPEWRRAVEAINMILRFSLMLAVAQILFVFVLGKPVLELLFDDKYNHHVLVYTQRITIAISILCITLPLLSVISNLASLRKAFFQIFLPALVFGLGAYVWAAWQGGAGALATANIVVYAFIGIGLIVFTIRHCPFSLELTLLSDREKGLIRQMLGSRP